jgi:hypothetical protein
MVSITPQDSSPITVVLSTVTELPAVVTRDSAPRYISPGLQAFEERRKEGLGDFIDASQLWKDEARQHGVLTRPAPDFSRIETDDHAGIEFHASAATTPAWIPRTNTDCGVLLLWTRERKSLGAAGG